MKITLKTLAPAGPSIHEALDEGILGRISGRDVVPIDLSVIGKGQDRVRGELGPIVADSGSGLSTGLEQRCQFPRNPCAGQGRVGDQGEALPRAIVDHGQHAEAAAIGQLVGHEVERPTLVRHQRQRHRGSRPYRLLAPAATPDMQPFLAVDAEQALVIHLMTLTAQEDMQSPIAEPAAHTRQLLQPLAQHRIVLSDGLVAHGHATTADHPARPPLAHPVACHQMCDRLPLSGGRHH